MKSKNADYGWDIDMTFFRALRVICWRAIIGDTWRGISYTWNDKYPESPPLDFDSNQFHGMSVIDCAATKLGFNSLESRLLN